MSAPDRDDALARLAAEAERILAAGDEPDADGLADRFGVPPEDATRCLASLRALDEALLADLDVECPLPRPELPDDYELLGEIGRGGMGVVYRARQRSLDREVAVKVVRPASLRFEQTVRRFRREARSLARLRHPGIVSVHEVGTAGDAVWFAMDLVEGDSLADRLRDGPLPPSEAVRVVAQAASAVAHAHGRGIVHRDLKPANVLLDRDGDVWVVDFGLAREEGMSLDATGTGHLLGTPAYMAPEQARGDATSVGERTDVYALGALLYECLCGRPLFADGSLANVVHAVLHRDPIPLGKRLRGVPADLETIVMRATAKRPERRYATAKAFLADLRAFEQGAPIRARRPGRAYALGRFVGRRWRGVATVLATAAVAVAAVLLVVVPRIGRTPRTMLRTAEELLDRGEPTAARILLEQALARPETRGGEVEGKIWRTLAPARAGTVRRMVLAGDLDAAEALAERTLEDADRTFETRGMPGSDVAWPGREGLLWDRARIAGVRGDVSAMARRLGEMEHRLWRTGIRDARARIVDRILDALHHPPPSREVALRILAERAVWTPAREVAARVLRRGPEVARTILVDLVRLGEDRARTLVDALAGELLAASPGAGDRLAHLAGDAAAPGSVRETALRTLVLAADLPETDRAVELWSEIRDAPFDQSLRARIDAAVESGDAAWLRVHTGHGPRETIDWPAWWAARRDGDPGGWFAPAVAAAPADVDVLLPKLRAARDSMRFPWHLRLRLGVAWDVRAPLFRPSWADRSSVGVSPSQLVAAWRAALAPPSDDRPWVVRVAWFRCLGADPARILREEVRSLRPGEGVVLDGAYEESPFGFAGSYTLPGLVAPVPPPPRSRTAWTATLSLGRGDEGLVLSGSPGRVVFTSGGGRSSHGAPGNRSVPAGMVLAFDGLESYGRRGEGPVRNVFPLAVATRPGSDDGPWTVDDWRARVRDNLESFAEGVETDRPEHGFELGPFALRYQQVGWLHPRIAAKLGLPGAGPLLVRARMPGHWSGQPDVLVRARLAAGDASVLDGESDERLRGIAGDLDDDMGPPQWWGRVVLTAEDARIRAFAASVLAEAELPLAVAARLEQAVDDEGLEVAPELRSRLEGAWWRLLRARASDMAVWLVFGGLFWLLAAVSFLRVAWPGRPLRRRLVPASWLVFCGVGFLALGLRYGEVPLLPEEAGIAMALLGAAVLARAADGRARRVVVAALLIALVGAVVARLGGGDGWRFAAGAGTGLALVLLPRLGHGLDDGGRPHRRFPVFAICYGMPVLLTWGISVFVLVRGTEAELELGEVLGGIVLLVISVALLWALLDLRAKASVRAWRMAREEG